MITFDSTQIQSITAQSDPISSAFSGPDKVFGQNPLFRFIEGFPEDISGLYADGSLKSTYVEYRTETGGQVGMYASDVVSRYLKEESFIDSETGKEFKIYGVDLYYGTNTVTPQIYACVKLDCGESSYLRFNLTGIIIPAYKVDATYKKGRRLLEIRGSGLEVIDFFGCHFPDSSNGEVAILKLNCPNLKQIRICRKMYDQISGQIPEGVQVTILEE